MFTRNATVLSALALSLALSATTFAESKAKALLETAVATSPTDAANERIKAMLENLGYEVIVTRTDKGGAFNRITFERNGWTMHLGVNVSENGKYVWAIANLQSAEGVRKYTSDQLLALLSENWHMHPFRFQVGAAGLYLGGVMDAGSLTNASLRKLIDETAEKVQSTVALWEIKTPTASAAAQPK